MRTLTLTLLLFFLVELQAQVVFCPQGARWTAVFSGGIWDPFIYNSSVEYVRDSVQGTDTVKLLRHSKFFNYCNQGGFFISEIKQKGDTVFFRNKYTQQQWQILVNYNCAVGQSWITNYTVPPNQAMETHTFTVDSVDYILENSIQLKRLLIKNQNSYYPTPNYTMHCVERYAWGFLFQFQGRLSGCDGDGMIESLCYSDNQFGTKYFGAKAWDYSNLLGLSERDHKQVVSVAPNPSSGRIVMNGLEAESPITIYNASGKAILKLQQKNNPELDLSELNDGIYLLRVENKGPGIRLLIKK